MINFIKEIFADSYKSTIAATTFTIVCIVSEYRNFSYIKWGDFELSFDVLYFFSLSAAIILWTCLLGNGLKYLGLLIHKKNILKTLKDCTQQEKEFLYNRIFENNNGRDIDFRYDSYFYKHVGYDTTEPYRCDLLTKEKILIFLRKLENKGILQSDSRHTMIIPQQVWDILVKYSDEIFKRQKRGEWGTKNCEMPPTDIVKERRRLFSLLEEAVCKIYRNYSKVFERRGLEQCIVALIYAQLFQAVSESEYAELDLSSEYTKNGNSVKATSNFPQGVRPDIILHRMWSNKENKIAIEFKGWWNNDSDKDIKKLKDLTSPDEEYKYLIGVWVLLGQDKPVFKFVIDGEEKDSL